MHALRVRVEINSQQRSVRKQSYLPRNLGRSGPYHSMAALLRTLVCKASSKTKGGHESVTKVQDRSNYANQGERCALLASTEHIQTHDNMVRG
jgi:hypothetical protein